MRRLTGLKNHKRDCQVLQQERQRGRKLDRVQGRELELELEGEPDPNHCLKIPVWQGLGSR